MDIVFEKEKSNQIRINGKTNYNINELVSVKTDLKKCLSIPVEDMNMICYLNSEHDVYIEDVIKFKTNIELPEQFEKMAFIVSKKIMLRTKQFIENMK
jgi:hypothetical protein